MNALVGYSIDDNNFILSPERVLYWEDRKTLILADLHAGKTGHFRKSGIAIPQKVFREDLQRLLTQVLFFKAEQLIIVGDFSHSKSNQELDLFVRWRHDFSSLRIFLVKGNHDILQDKWYEEAEIGISNEELGIGNFLFRHDLKKTAISNRQQAIGKRQQAPDSYRDGNWQEAIGNRLQATGNKQQPTGKKQSSGSIQQSVIPPKGVSQGALRCLRTNPEPETRYTFSGHIHPGISIHGLAKQSLHFPCFYFTDNYCVLPAFSRFTGTHGIDPKKGENIFAIVENQILQVQ